MSSTATKKKATLHVLQIEATEEDIEKIERKLSRWIRSTRTADGSSWNCEHLECHKIRKQQLDFCAACESPLHHEHCDNEGCELYFHKGGA
jgi:hypothetical protein